jgi:hypothetical protein
MKSLVEIFVAVDDFCKAFLPQFEGHLLQSAYPVKTSSQSFHSRKSVF